MSRIRVLLAHNHELLLEGLRSLVANEDDLEIVGVALTADQLMEVVRDKRPDVIVLDGTLQGAAGMACLRAVRAEALACSVLVLLERDDLEAIRRALEFGVDGCAVASEPAAQLIAAIRQVHRGQIVFPLSARRLLVGEAEAPDPDRLTERELGVLELVAEGATNPQIAQRLGLSANTVKFHLRHLFLKLGVGNRTEAAARYLRELSPRR
jgi:DNA-binding NarL/FixJ family response regulator